MSTLLYSDTMWEYDKRNPRMNRGCIITKIDTIQPRDNKKILQVLLYNDRVVQSRKKGGIISERYSLASDELAKYLHFFIPSAELDTKEILQELKELVAENLPIQPTNEYEFNLLLSVWNQYRNHIKRDQIALFEDRITIQTTNGLFTVHKNSYKTDLMFPIDENIAPTEYVYDTMVKGDYGTKTLTVPYVTEKWVESLIKDHANYFLTTQELHMIAHEVFGWNIWILTYLLFQHETGERIGSGTYNNLRSESSTGTRVINDQGSPRILWWAWNIYADHRKSAFPLIHIQRST